MAAPGKPASSRWGSFLSQAVAGVESRLDNMLTDADAAQQGQQQQQEAAPVQPVPTKPMQAPTLAAPKASPGVSRSSSNNRANDRLQAKLAKAIAGKNAPPSVSPRASVDQGSARSSTELRPSTEKDQADRTATPTDSPTATGATSSPSTTAPATPIVDTSSEKPSDEPAGDAQPDDTTDVESSKVEESTNPAIVGPVQADADETESSKPDNRATDMSQLSRDVEEIKVRQNEEIQEYVERIDSLQAKLQYLSKNAADAAKKAASSAPSGSLERKLAEKDERIALLMNEGQRLSNTEQKYRTTIKKLRLQITDTERQVDDLKKGKDKAISDAEVLRTRLDGDEEKEKRQEETQRATTALQKEIEALKKEKSAKDEAIRTLEQELKAKAEKAEAANAETLSKALATAAEKQKELEDTIATLRADKESQSEAFRRETIELREKLDRGTERARLVEEELKLELRAAESKLEAMRTAAEEASSGSGGEAQVKLLRQIETLQSQYATASDNWQGIESSLLAKVANLEKERDEAQRRESEMRKKARDAASRSRRLEEELQDVQPEYATSQRELEASREELATLRSTLKTTETALQQARADLEKRQQSRSRDDVAEAARRQWVEDVAGATSRNQSRPDSPLLSVPTRTYSSDLAGFPLPGRSRRAPTPGSIPDAPEGLGLVRRLSGQPPGRPNASSMAGSMPPPSPFLPFEPPNDQHTPDREDGVDETAPSSPRHMAQDMISVSTVAAGPSVQLVERMSAAIRRLEAEKVAAREEMARVCNQRDEARGDMVGLMKDLESAKAAMGRVTDLEGEVAALNSRYQTTLELLGEKSELVEELRADVQDVKDMYRELVERTVK